MTLKKIFAALALAATLTPFAGAHAATISFSNSKATATTNWNDVLTFGKFDTTLGTLTSIQFELDGAILGSGSAESLDAAFSNVSLSLGALLGLTRPDGSTLVIAKPVFTQNFGFSAFDGAIDFGGTSGGRTGTVSATGSNSFVSFNANDFSLFSALGGGNINLGLSATGSSSGSGAGNLITQFSTAASGDVRVIYNYTAATSNVPEPASLATLLAGLGLMGVVRRRAAKKK